MARDFLRQMPGIAGTSTRIGLLSRLHVDIYLLVLLLLLTVGGLIVLYSASNMDLATVERQAVFFVLGYIVMFAVAQISPHLLMQVAPIMYGGGVVLLVAVEVKGVTVMGAQRWLDLPGLPRFQPAEILKLAMPMMLATYFDRRLLPPRFRYVFWSLVMLSLPVVMVARQPDLGTSLLIAASGLVVLFMAGLGWRYILAAFTAVATAAPLMWFFVLRDYQKQRIHTLLDPEGDKLGAGWNIIQSTTAIGSGGWDGKGWLLGSQSHLDFLPESHTDFIIAVLSEEFGFIGVCALLLVYVLIIARCIWIATNAQDTFGRLMASALAITFFIYVFVNMGMVAGILPIVGVPLPLMSNGGTAIIILMTGFGILMGISTERKRMGRQGKV